MIIHIRDADTAFTRLDLFVADWLSGSEVIGEDEEGRDGTISLTERDQYMRQDAIHGLLADEEFMDLVVAARRFQMEERRKEHRCQICGGRDDVHWGNHKGRATLESSANNSPVKT